MKVKLWNVKTKSKKSMLWGDSEEFVINGQTVDQILKKANNLKQKSHWIIEIEWLASED